MAMLEFAEKVSKDSASITETDFQKLHAQGFTDEDIWDIAGQSSYWTKQKNSVAFRSLVCRCDQVFVPAQDHG